MAPNDRSVRVSHLVLCVEKAIDRVGADEVLAFMHRELVQGRVSSMNGNVEEALCAFGQPYKRELPARIRRGPMGQCFLNAFSRADSGKGQYVEGFALREGRLVHHAWITRDGTGAVEVTWPKTSSAAYFGISVANINLLTKIIVNNGGFPGILLDRPSQDWRDVMLFLRCNAPCASQ